MSISEEESENLASLVNQLRGKAELPDLNIDNQKLYLYICSVSKEPTGFLFNNILFSVLCHL